MESQAADEQRYTDVMDKDEQRAKLLGTMRGIKAKQAESEANAKARNEAKHEEKNGNPSQSNQSVFVLIVDGKAAGKGDVGHTGLQVGKDVYSFYPTDVDGDGQWDLQCSPGEMRKETRKQFDNHYEKDGITSFQIDVSDQQFASIGKKLETFRKFPGEYCLTGNQCTSVAANVLLGAGINIRERIIRRDFSVIEKLNTNLLSPSSLLKVLSDEINKNIVQKKWTYGRK
jgi:hypothetical protein